MSDLNQSLYCPACEKVQKSFITIEKVMSETEPGRVVGNQSKKDFQCGSTFAYWYNGRKWEWSKLCQETSMQSGQENVQMDIFTST